MVPTMRLAQVLLFVKDVPCVQRFHEGTIGLAVLSSEEGPLRRQ